MKKKSVEKADGIIITPTPVALASPHCQIPALYYKLLNGETSVNGIWWVDRRGDELNQR